MSILPKTKFGNCANPECGAKDTEVVKVGKETYCVFCRQNQKAKVQVEKANLRNRVRGLRGHQVELGNEQAASRQNLINDLDYVFSRIVRLRAADEHGNCECITCGTKKHFSMIQAGHYQKRGNMALRWDFRNVYPQCSKCNEINSGEIKAFSDKLEQLQAGMPETLANEARIVFKHSLDELKVMLIDFRAKLRLLEAKPTPHS